LAAVTDHPVPPPKLVQLRRDFDATEARCEEIGATFPRPTAIAAGIAAPTAEQVAALDAARAERGRILGEMLADSWWDSVPNYLAGREALRAAARE
jgi:hypothetical protein